MSSSLKIAFQMDAFEHLNNASDSSLALAFEAQERGHQLHHYLPETLSLFEGKLTVSACVFKVSADGLHIDCGERQKLGLDGMDVVLIRQDPPFDMAYITSTYLLEHLKGKALVLNDPKAIRTHPEKLLMMHFPDLIPPTLITNNIDDIQHFQKEYQEIIIKPLYGHGGFAVVHLDQDDQNLSSLMELFNAYTKEQIIVQKFLPEVRMGDKRICLIDGEYISGINRVPPKGAFRSNMRVGGQAEKLEMTKRDFEICERISDILKKEDLFFTGIDVIGPYLTEINVTSPTGLRAMNKINNQKVEKTFWDLLEKRYL